MPIHEKRPLLWCCCVKCIYFILRLSTPPIEGWCKVLFSIKKINELYAPGCDFLGKMFGKKCGFVGNNEHQDKCSYNSTKNWLFISAHSSVQQINMQNMSISMYILCHSFIFAGFMYVRIESVLGVWSFFVISCFSSHSAVSIWVECARKVRSLRTLLCRVGNLIASSWQVSVNYNPYKSNFKNSVYITAFSVCFDMIGIMANSRFITGNTVYNQFWLLSTFCMLVELKNKVVY